MEEGLRYWSSCRVHLNCPGTIWGFRRRKQVHQPGQSRSAFTDTMSRAGEGDPLHPERKHFPFQGDFCKHLHPPE